MIRNFKPWYKKSLNALGKNLHFCAHSHHLWPDVTEKAHLKYWEDSAKMLDDKWGYVFSQVIPSVQSNIAQILNIKEAKQIALAPNSHELMTRLMSCFIGKKKLKILTTDSEFYSFARQLQRLEEFPEVEVIRLKTDEILVDRASFINHFLGALSDNSIDLIYFSHVFFNSGLSLTDKELELILASAPESAYTVIDGYHAFGAIPIDGKVFQDKAFYLGGGYKYVQAGEGVGFMYIPEKYQLRPVNTGWFAQYGELTQTPQGVGYSSDGASFWGATQDPSGWYRFNEVCALLKRSGVSFTDIHLHVQDLQVHFCNHLTEVNFLKNYKLLTKSIQHHGHFLTFEGKDEAHTKELYDKLRSVGVLTDYRSNRLRFGFGAYHDLADVDELLKRLKTL